MQCVEGAKQEAQVEADRIVAEATKQIGELTPAILDAVSKPAKSKYMVFIARRYCAADKG